MNIPCCFKRSSVAGRIHLATVIVTLVAVFGMTQAASAQHRIKDFCHVKGQESNTLRGVGLVVGLNGSGDPNLATTRQAVARALVNSGIELPVDAFGREDLQDFQNVANAALVFVTVKVPAEGARQGTLIDCKVHTFGNANSLSGGTLLETPLTGGLATGDSGSLPVFAMASGKIETNPRDVVTTGAIANGCQLMADFNNEYFYYLEDPVENEVAPLPNARQRNRHMFVDLIIDKNHSSWQLAHDIALEINDNPELFGLGDGRLDSIPQEIALALDQVTVRVEVPEFHEQDPVAFVSSLMNLGVVSADRSNVVINEATGTIIVGRDVSFRPVAITSGDFAIEDGTFRSLDLEQVGLLDDVEMKLSDLVTALNALQAPPETMIDIIRELDRAGKIIGEVHFE